MYLRPSLHLPVPYHIQSHNGWSSFLHTFTQVLRAKTFLYLALIFHNDNTITPKQTARMQFSKIFLALSLAVAAMALPASINTRGCDPTFASGVDKRCNHMGSTSLPTTTSKRDAEAAKGSSRFFSNRTQPTSPFSGENVD